jgi:chromosome segregation ATPase
MILVDFAALDMQNATLAENQMKDFIATPAGLPPFQVENQLAQLNKPVVTQATTIAEVRERNSAFMKEGKDLVEKKMNSDQELALTQQRVKDLEASVPICTHEDLQTKITQLEQQLARGVPVYMVELKQELEDAQEQLKVMGEERNEYRDQVKWVLALTGKNGSGGSRGHKGSEILHFSGALKRALHESIVQLAMKIADKPGLFFNEQSNMRYTAN